MEPFVDYSPITMRGDFRWPDNKKIAIVTVVNVEHYEFKPPFNPHKNPYPSVEAHPDTVGYSYRDYGNRVGIWRMLEVFDELQTPITCSLNVEVLELFPQITQAMQDRDWSYMSHGLYNTQYLFGMDPDDERKFHKMTIEKVERITGKKMRGLLGPSFTASAQTHEIIAEVGMNYTMDWFIDDQPFLFNVPKGQLVGVPYSRELNDAFIMPGSPFHAFEGDYFEQIVKDQFDRLYQEGGKVMTIALHPFYMGLPHQIQYLENFLSYIKNHEDVWWTTPEQIADYYLTQQNG